MCCTETHQPPTSQDPTPILHRGGDTWAGEVCPLISTPLCAGCAAALLGSWALLVPAAREGTPRAPGPLPARVSPALSISLPQTLSLLWALPTPLSCTVCLVQVASKPSSGTSGSAKLGKEKKVSDLSQENRKSMCLN